MEFQGFQSSFSLTTVLLIGALLVFIAFFSYQKHKSLLPNIRLILSTLRALTFVIVALLIFNPVFFKSEMEERTPKVMALFDNSESMSIVKGNYDGANSYNAVLNQLDLNNQQELTIDHFAFGNDARPIQSADSLSLSETQTNFLETITQIEELQDDYSAVILISDGILTFGRNPLIQAAGLTIPIYVIATGDTALVRDITINNILTNSTGYTETNHVVEVEIAQNGFIGTSTTLNIIDAAGKLISEEDIAFSANEEVQTIRVELPLSKEGLQAFQVEVTPLSEEWSNDNNRRTFSIDVLDSKTRILHIASEIHPDVKALRSLLLSDPAYELQTLTWLGGNNFVEDEIPNTEKLDLIILHGQPQSNWLPTQNELLNQVPTLYLDLPKTRQNNSNNSSFALIANQGAQVFELNVIPNQNQQDHPILEVDEVNYDALLPILTSLRTTSNSVDVIPLLNSQFQNMNTENPVLAISERGNSRRAHFAAWGWHRLLQSTNADERNFVGELFLNVITWASNNPDERLLSISPSKTSFSSSEAVNINASLVNESGEPEPDATIEFHLIDENGNDRVFNLLNNGSGRYSLLFDALSNGLYSFTATARKGSRVLDEQGGEFLIEDSSSELINTVRNDAFLSSLASETGGEFFIYNNIENFWSTIRNNGIMETTKELVESYIHPIRSFIWFILVILLLATEWLIRKNYSLP